MVAANFESCLGITLHWEGGYTNDADDPGGPTNLGIIQREYNAWRAKNNLPLRSVRWIEMSEARDIYRREYWDAMHCDDLAPGLDLVVFDAAVNNGVGRATHWLNTVPHDIDSYCNVRLAFDRSLGRLWQVFGAGWSRRIAGIRAQARQLEAGKPVWTVAMIQEALNRVLASPVPLTVDDALGPLTIAAIKQFQQTRNLAVTGLADESTLLALASL